MYCCKCGAQTYNDSRFCHRCGSPVPAQSQPHSSSDSEQEQQRLVYELLSKDQKLHECHRCGGKDRLFAWDFGLGKPIASKRVWASTAASLAVSAMRSEERRVGKECRSRW